MFMRQYTCSKRLHGCHLRCFDDIFLFSGLKAPARNRPVRLGPEDEYFLGFLCKRLTSASVSFCWLLMVSDELGDREEREEVEDDE